MLQRKGGFAIGKGHVAILAADSRIVEGHGEVEFLIRFPGVARHGFGDGQISRFRRGRCVSLVIGECSLSCCIRLNRTADGAGFRHD